MTTFTWCEWRCVSAQWLKGERKRDWLYTHRQMVKMTKTCHRILYIHYKGKMCHSSNQNFSNSRTEEKETTKKSQWCLLQIAFPKMSWVLVSKWPSFIQMFTGTIVYFYFFPLETAAWHEFSTDVKGSMSQSGHVRSQASWCWKGGQGIDLCAVSYEVFDSYLTGTINGRFADLVSILNICTMQFFFFLQTETCRLWLFVWKCFKKQWQTLKNADYS